MSSEGLWASSRDGNAMPSTKKPGLLKLWALAVELRELWDVGSSWGIKTKRRWHACINVYMHIWNLESTLNITLSLEFLRKWSTLASMLVSLSLSITVTIRWRPTQSPSDATVSKWLCSMAAMIPLLSQPTGRRRSWHNSQSPWWRFGASGLPAVHVSDLSAVLLHTRMTVNIVPLLFGSNIQGIFCSAGFAAFRPHRCWVSTEFKDSGKDIGDDRCPVAFFLHLRSPLRVINTTTGLLLRFTLSFSKFLENMNLCQLVQLKLIQPPPPPTHRHHPLSFLFKINTFFYWLEKRI